MEVINVGSQGLAKEADVPSDFYPEKIDSKFVGKMGDFGSSLSLFAFPLYLILSLSLLDISYPL